MASYNSSDQTIHDEQSTISTVSENSEVSEYCVPTSEKWGDDDDGDEASVWSTSPPQPGTIETIEDEEALWHFNPSPSIDASERAWPPFSGAQKTPDPEPLKSEDVTANNPNQPHGEAKKSVAPVGSAGNKKIPVPEPIKDSSYDQPWWSARQTTNCPCSWCDPKFHTRRHSIHANKNKGWDFGVAAMLDIPRLRIRAEEKAPDPEPLWIQDENMPYVPEWWKPSDSNAF